VSSELRTRGHAVTFVARAGTEGKVLAPLRALGVEDVHTLAFGGRRDPLGTAQDLRALATLLGAHDVVHVHRGKEHWMTALAGALVSRPVPVIRTRHIARPVSGHSLNRWLYRRRTAHVVAVSERIRRQYIEARLAEPERVTTVLGGVDHRRFHPAVDGLPFRRAAGLAEREPLVGILGGFRAMKGHATFLHAARLVVASRPAVRFLLLGEGPQREAIRRLIGELDLDRSVRVIGRVAAPERALAALDVAVYAADASEGMGRVPFEYMAMARPIVATAVGLVPEVLADGETAAVVPPKDPVALAHAIVRVLDDARFGAAAGRACRRLVEERYSGAAVAATLEALYRRCLPAAARCRA
jgi:glycosyltransferase involved in cell wall biosynthesis